MWLAKGYENLVPGLVDQVSIMGSVRQSRRQELAQLELQLASVSRQLDEIEKRALGKQAIGESEATEIGRLSASTSENTETRFAACVASGLSKIRPV